MTAWLRDDPTALDESHDAFGVLPAARALAGQLHQWAPPLVIGLSGSWGVGKSTFAKAVRSELPAGVVSCYIDLWTEDLSHLRRTIIIEASGAVHGDHGRLTAAAKLDEALRTSATTTSPPVASLRTEALFGAVIHQPIRAVLSAVLLIGAVVLASVLSSGGLQLQSVGTLISTVVGGLVVFLLLSSGLVISTTTTSRSSAPAQEGLALRKAFSDLSTELRSPVLIVLDNLDRLTSADALAVLSDIRSFMEIQGSRCLFFVPVDRAALAAQLERELGDQRAARDYLDKFFSLEITLTSPPVADIRGWVRELAREILTEEDDIPRVTQVVASASRRTPRVAKRILNGVATRTALLAATGKNHDAAQVAFVEALLVRFPFVVPTVETEPRRLADARTAIAAASTRVQRVARFADLFGKKPPELSSLEMELLEFLLENRDIQLSTGQLTAIATLRSDRLWSRVPNGEDIERALRTGQADEMRSAIATLSAPADAVALEAALAWGEESLKQGYGRDAVNSAVALAPVMVGAGHQRERLRNLAYEGLLTGGEESFKALTDPVIELTLGDNGSPAQAANLWRRSVELLRDANEGEGRPPTPAELRALKQGATWVQATELRQAQGMLAAAVPAGVDVAPLFEEPIVPELIDAAVGAALVDWLRAWPKADEAAWNLAATRVEQARRAGWDDAARDTALAMAVQAQVSPEAGSVEGKARLRAAVRALHGAASSDAIDTLAMQLSGASGPTLVTPLILALELPYSDEQAVELRTAGETWLESAEAQFIWQLVQEADLQRLGLKPWQAIRDRWVSSEDSDLLDILASGPDEARGEVASGVAAATNKWALATAGIAALGAVRDTAAIEEVVRRACERTSALLPSASQAIEAVSSAKQAGADISPVARALVGLIPAISDRETLTMAVALAQVAADSPETARELSESAAERAMAIGIPHESADWLLRNAGRTADLRRAIQDEIRAGDLRESLSLIRPIRRALRYNAGIAGAVAQRLARGDVQCELVIEALEEMANWKDGIGRFREEIDAAIGVAGQCEGSGTAIGLLREVLDS